MVVRDELLVIIDITPTVVRAGVGVYDLIRRPQIEVSTRIGRKLNSATPPKLTDYVVGHLIAQAQDQGQQLDFIQSIQHGPFGMTINDWTAFAALMRYVFHQGLSLPRPPLAHPCFVSIPPHLPTRLVDELHSFFFEHMLIPQLLIASRPFVASAAAGVTNAIVVDIGARGEQTTISIINDNHLIERANMSTRLLNEGILDDYLAIKILEKDSTLLNTLSQSQSQQQQSDDENQSLTPESLSWAMRTIVHSLKETNSIGFQSPLFQSKTGTNNLSTSNQNVDSMLGNEEGELDVAKVLIEGKLDKIVNKKSTTKTNNSTTNKEEGDFVSIPNPFDSNLPNIKIGPVRHQYLEPLFEPVVLECLNPLKSNLALELGFKEYEGLETLHTGLQEMMGVVLGQIDKIEDRASALESVVVVSTGKVANNRALGSTLVTLLSPYSIDNDSTHESSTKTTRYIKTPDYFSEFKTREGELTCFLGSSILSKILISDLQSRLFMSKVDYSQKGPSFYRLLDLIV
ncbi:hypothetical protein OIO90_005663 [Microbotryomycetes sp. JL221]|nr:hypothetical protein OIO90_005663 [Microbotryomycetes sp. JL221]